MGVQSLEKDKRVFTQTPKATSTSFSALRLRFHRLLMLSGDCLTNVHSAPWSSMRHGQVGDWMSKDPNYTVLVFSKMSSVNFISNLPSLAHFVSIEMRKLDWMLLSSPSISGM